MFFARGVEAAAVENIMVKELQCFFGIGHGHGAAAVKNMVKECTIARQY
jgi:hypothetical protein